jgi:hypothetical protein
MNDNMTMLVFRVLTGITHLVLRVYLGVKRVTNGYLKQTVMAKPSI